MSVGFVILGALGLWRWAMILLAAQLPIIALMLLDMWWQFRKMDKAYIRLVAIVKMAELTDSGIHPVHYRERYELYADMKKNPGKYLKTLPWVLLG